MIWFCFMQLPRSYLQEKSKKLLAEINNGRLAMVAMAAIVAQNGATGQSLVEQFTTGTFSLSEVSFVFILVHPEGPELGRVIACDSIWSRFFFTFPRGNLNPFIGGYARSDRMALRANSEALPWEPVPEGLTNDIFGPYVPRQQQIRTIRMTDCRNQVRMKKMDKKSTRLQCWGFDFARILVHQYSLPRYTISDW